MDRDKRDNLILLKPKYLFSRLTLGGTLSLSVPARRDLIQNQPKKFLSQRGVKR